MQSKTLTKAQLAAQYGVHKITLNKWLKLIPNLELSQNQKILTPKQIKIIKESLGEP